MVGKQAISVVQSGLEGGLCLSNFHGPQKGWWLFTNGKLEGFEQVNKFVEKEYLKMKGFCLAKDLV